MPKFVTKEQLESTEEGRSGVDHVATSPIPGVEESPGVPAKWLGSALRIIASRVVPLLAKIDRSGIMKVSRDVADPTAIETSEKGQPGGVATLDGAQKVPTNQIPDALLGSTRYQGVWNAATNTPNLSTVAKERGFYWEVSVAGSTSLSGETDWSAGDFAIWDGTDFDKIDNTESVSSYNGRRGTITSQLSDITPHGLGSDRHSDVRNAPQDGQAVIFRQAGASGMGYYHESPGAASVPNASETEAGKVEKAVASEAQSGTDAGTSGPLYVSPSVLKALLIPPDAYCDLTRSTNQVVQNAAWTPIEWTQENLDPRGWHGTDLSRIAPGVAGVYAVTLHTRWSAANSAGLRAQAVGLNGAAVPEMINSLVQSALQPNGAMTYSYEIILPNATDYITCYCRQTVGNEYSLDPFTKVVVARVR